ncbi:unnamed protein product [Calypogeia fissa]
MAEVKASQESLSSHLAGLRLSSGSNNENSEEKTIYENLMEIFPLMEDFMKNQGRPSFAHQSPMSFTRAPSRQVPQKRKLEQKPMWTNGVELSDRSEANLQPLNVPLAQDLQRDIDELSNRLRETQLQSSAATKELQSTLESKETQLVEMELMVRRLQKEIQRREQVVYSAQRELADTKDEVARMRSIMRKAESNISETNNKSAGIEQELLGLQLQLSELYSVVESNDQILSESLSIARAPLSGRDSVGWSRTDRMDWHRRSKAKMELARKAYLASVIVARQTNEESPLMLCAILRFQLEAFLTQTDSVDSQVARLAYPHKQFRSASS